MIRIVLLVALAMVAFAANSLLARAALAGPHIDAGAYTIIRLCAGALVLALLIGTQHGVAAIARVKGTWRSALALFIYAFAFSFAYLRLGAATGTLILFGAVQCTMLAWGLMRRDRPNLFELTGLVMAFGALIYLLAPGIARPDPVGSLLMALSGIAWGVYSLRGKASADPLADTAGNFIRCVPFCIALFALPQTGHTLSPTGTLLAIASGALASGLGYAIWYRALPGLSTLQAAIVQLTVPIIAAIGAIVLLAETLTWRLAIAAIFVLGGVALAIFARPPARHARAPLAPGADKH